MSAERKARTVKSKRALPAARKEGLEVQVVADEILIYDRERHRAHCLNPVAALVFRRCDGKTTMGEAVKALRQELSLRADERFVELVLARLEKAHLLGTSVSPKLSYSRRELVKKLNKLGLAASMALPLITSIVSPVPAQAQSCVPANACASVPNCTPCGNCATRVCCQIFIFRLCVPRGFANRIGCCP